MLEKSEIESIAAELERAEQTQELIPRITARYPNATIEDSYAIQGMWRDRQVAAGRRPPTRRPQDRPHVESDAGRNRHFGARLRCHV